MRRLSPPSTRGEKNTLYQTLVTIHESAEMPGIILFVRVLPKIIEEKPGQIAVDVADERRSSDREMRP